jgi:hypothetical protein
MTTTTTTGGGDVIDVFLTFALLPEACQPIVVTRVDGVTLVTVDAEATKREALAACVDRLTTAELNAYRRAYGVPPVGQPSPEDWLSDEPVDLNVPAVLRLDA